MKKEFLISTSVLKKYFVVLFLLMGFTGYINAQNINFTAAERCPNNGYVLAGQVLGEVIFNDGPSKWVIPSITAVHPPGGGTITMSITNIDAESAGANFNICSSCTSPFTTQGITFTTSGANFTIAGKPTFAPIKYFITVTASAGGATCQRTYTLNIFASVADRGDPHITTADGVHYDFQSVGEFTTLRDSAGSFEIQTRQTAVATNGPGTDSYTGLSTCVSLNTAVAARVGTHRVSYQPNINGNPDPSGMQLRVDGKLTELGENGLDLGSGGRALKSSAGPGVIEIDFPDGASLVVTPGWWPSYSVWYLNVDIYRTAATKGIMGVRAANNTTPGIGVSHILAKSKSWLPALPDGSSLGPMPTDRHERFVQLYTTFADAWRVTDKTSLFDYASGTSTATFTNKAWPAENAKSCSIPNHTPQVPIERLVAEQLCRDIVDSNMRANAIFDVMITGDSGFAKTYLLTQRVQTGTTETTVAVNKDTTNYGDSVNITATVSPKFSRKNALLNGSVEFTADGEKLGKVKLDGDGRAVLTTTSLKVGRHQIVAMFLPDSGSTAFSSSSLNMTHTVIGTNGTSILHQWWFWLLVLLIVGIIIALLRKKGNP